jgi:hypothetical protein
MMLGPGSCIYVQTHLLNKHEKGDWTGGFDFNFFYIF